MLFGTIQTALEDPWTGLYIGIQTMIFITAGIYVIRNKWSGKLASRSLIALLIADIVIICTRIWDTWSFLVHKPDGKFFLPPHSLFYLNKFIWINNSYIAAALAAGIVFFLLWRLARQSGFKFIDNTDVTLAALGTYVSGWPNFFIFFALIFICAVIWTLFLALIGKRQWSDRLVITPLWAPAAILTILFGSWLSQITGLSVIRF